MTLPMHAHRDVRSMTLPMHATHHHSGNAYAHVQCHPTTNADITPVSNFADHCYVLQVSKSDAKAVQRLLIALGTPPNANGPRPGVALVLAAGHRPVPGTGLCLGLGGARCGKRM